jgi:hypothetical protein
MKVTGIALAVLLGGAMTVWVLNQALVGVPVQRSVAVAAGQSTFHLKGHFRGYVQASEVVLDLRGVENTALASLADVLVHSAVALENRSLTRVTLARRGEPVFTLSGDDFRALGASHVAKSAPGVTRDLAAGEFPAALALPYLLRTPDGVAVYEEPSGTVVDLLTRNMQDLADAMRTWIGEDREVAAEGGPLRRH